MSKTPEIETDVDCQWPENRSRHDIDREIQPLHLEKEEHHDRPKYHKHGMFLVAYIPLITIPWALTCVMARRPLGASSFYNQIGFSKSEITKINGWVTAIDVVNSISGVVTIPTLSALIAQAAVVHSQKHKTGQTFHLNHLIALADRGWTNPTVLGRSWIWRERGSSAVRSFLYFAALIILLGSIQQPLYQALVSTEAILIPTCKDTKYMETVIFNKYDAPTCLYKKNPPKTLGWDIELAEMARIPHNAVFQKLMADLAVVSLNDVHSHLWINISKLESDKQALKDMGSESFTAALEQGTTTGVLREHIMRLNSSVTCGRIQRSQFPSTCEGENPFTRSFSHSDNFTRVCVPGKFGVLPWTLSRNRQEIVEELYLDVLEEVKPDLSDMPKFLTSNYTLHCTATTTRGYFELGNYRNNYTWGPLLNQWPGPGEMKTEYNDFLSGQYERDDLIPSELDDITLSTLWDDDFLDLMYSDSWYMSGPLAMVAISLFGNKTFFDTAILAWDDTTNDNDTDYLPYHQFCSFVPFARLDPDERDNSFPACYTSAERRPTWGNLKEYCSKWLLGFNDTHTATTALSTSMFLANEAVVTMDQWHAEYTARRGGYYDRTGRTIYSGVGASIHKPKLPIAAFVVITILLCLELLGLALLAWLIYRGPSETRSLDVMAVSRLMASMEEDKNSQLTAEPLQPMGATPRS